MDRGYRFVEEFWFPVHEIIHRSQSVLKRVGEYLSPGFFHPFIEFPVLPVSASATSGSASNAIDGINDRFFYSVWQSSSSLPQSITLDLGKEYANISILDYVPKYKTVTTPLTEGSIKSYKVYTSSDKINFT